MNIGMTVFRIRLTLFACTYCFNVFSKLSSFFTNVLILFAPGEEWFCKEENGCIPKNKPCNKICFDPGKRLKNFLNIFFDSL